MNAAPAYLQKRLDQVAEFLDDMRRDLPETARRPGPYPYYGGNGQQGTSDAYLFDEPLVLLAEDLSSFIGSGKPLAQAIDGKTWVNKRIHVLRPGAELDAEFLCRVLETIDIDRYASGARKSRLTRSRAAEIRVPLPSLEQQRRIALVLAQVDEFREQRRRTRTALDAFVRVYFLEHFGDPQTNSRRWPQLAFGTLGENQDALRTLAAADLNPAGQGYPRYSASAIVGWTNAPVFEGERLLVAEDGRSLVTRLDSVSQVVDGQFAVSRHAHVIAENARADLQYLRHALELIELRPYLTSAARPRLRRAALERIPIPVPPLELQRAFRALVERIRALQALQHASAERFDELHASLRLRALRGESLIADR